MAKLQGDRTSLAALLSGRPPTARLPSPDRGASLRLIPGLIVVIGAMAWVSPAFGAASALSGGKDHTCALLTGGSVRCWGANTWGQLGDGTTTARLTPVTVSGLPSAATRVVAGYGNSCAVLVDETVRCWGRNNGGQLGNGGTTDSNTPTKVAGLTGIVDLSAGWQHYCAATASGQVKCWGRDDSGQLGFVGGAPPSYAELLPKLVPGLSGISSLALGWIHSCGLKDTGAALCWGSNSTGQLGDGKPIDGNSRTPTPKPVVTPDGPLTGVGSLASGVGSHTCAILSGADGEGTVRCWGMNSQGQLGDGSTIDRSSAVIVPGVTEAISGALGYQHSCVLRQGPERKSIVCWGDNRSGQLGDGSRTDRLVPVTVTGLDEPVAVTAGFSHTCALTAGGAAYCWGENGNGQLGNGTKTSSSTPVEVPDLVDPPSITDGPADVTNETTASVSFTALEGAAAECSVDNGAFSPCASPLLLTGLAPGKHSVRIRQVTPAGRSDAALDSWTIDETPPPKPRLSGVPATTTTNRNATILISGEPGATFTCSIDGFEPSGCESPLPVTDLEDGTHTIRVSQTDPAGNTGPEATASWTIDSAALPQFGRYGEAGPTSGKVAIRLPGRRDPVALQPGMTVPVGSVIDARSGRLRLSVGKGRDGKPQVAEFTGGIFKFTQSRRTGITNLGLTGRLANCGRQKGLQAAGRRTRGRTLWGSGKGRFRTSGTRGSGSVRGTTWQVTDRCDGSTVIKSIRGLVAASDRSRGPKFVKLLKAGMSYTAKPPRKARKRR